MPVSSRVIVIDPGGPELDDLRHLLAAAGHDTIHASRIGDAVDRIGEADAVLLGTSADGLDAIATVAAVPVSPPVIALLTEGSPLQLREARRLGAVDALFRADGIDAVLLAVDRAIESGRLRREIAALRARSSDRVGESLIGRSPAIGAVRELIGRAVASRMPVLISGEAGSGKDVVARLIHDLSERAARPFVTVPCDAGTGAASLQAELFGSEATGGGLLHRAQGGTLVLERAEALSPEMRDRLARLIAESAASATSADGAAMAVRFILTTRDIATDAQSMLGERGSVQVGLLPIALPPLRERRSDIPLLVQYFRARLSREMGNLPLPPLAPDAILSLMGQPWPGNVRELEHFVERSVHRPGTTAGSTVATMYDDGATLDELERRYILHVLEREHGHQSRAADRLGIDRRTLYRKLKQYRDEDVAASA